MEGRPRSPWSAADCSAPVLRTRAVDGADASLTAAVMVERKEMCSGGAIAGSTSACMNLRPKKNTGGRKNKERQREKKRGSKK